MGLANALNQDYDNFFHNMANDIERESIALGNNKEYLKSWGLSFCARLPYLADVIVNLVTMPFYLLGCIFGTVLTIVTWGSETSLLTSCGNKLTEKFNHLCLSTFGALISPWVAHQFKDTNVALVGLLVMATVAGEVGKRTYFTIRVN